MRKNYTILSLVLIIILGWGVCQGSVHASDEEKTVDVLFLHDTHSHLNAFSTVENGESQNMGGFARIKTLIKEQKEKNPDTFLLDGGDFS